MDICEGTSQVGCCGLLSLTALVAWSGKVSWGREGQEVGFATCVRF